MMIDNPYERILARLNITGITARRTLAFCPAHDDRTDPSLSIKEGEDGRVLINCFAGCTTPDIVRALRLQMRDLFRNEAALTAPRAIGEPPTSEQLNAGYRRALDAIIAARSADRRDAPITSGEINRALTMTVAAFGLPAHAPRNANAWEAHPPWDADPLWPTWYMQTLCAVILERCGREPNAPAGARGEAQPADHLIAAKRTATALRAYRTPN